jgi:hypothetical protein
MNKTNKHKKKLNHKKKLKTKKYIYKKKYFKKGGDYCSPYKDDNDWQQLFANWPTNYGCNNTETLITLPVGKILDRIGWHKGYFLSEPGYSFDSRSLRQIRNDSKCKQIYYNRINKDSLENNKPKIDYYQFEILKPFNVMMCNALSFFGHKGGAVQYRLFENSLNKNELSLISDKTDYSDANGNIIPTIKVPNVEELINLEYIKLINPPKSIPDFS